MKGLILMNRTLVNMAVTLVAAAVAGMGVATVTVGTAPAETGSTYLNYYETLCQTAARDAYGVPLFNDALVQWQLDHLGTDEGAAYNAAALACPQPAKWDFAHMVLVGSE